MKTVLIIILILFALRLLIRIFRPHIMNFVMRKIEKKINASMGFETDYEEPKRQKEGDITIDRMPHSIKTKRDTSNLGEYVDFEEIE